jgi:uncharacterized repeat protein (TIGR01451 family)
LVAGSVQSSQGRVTQGNTEGDTGVAVDLGLIAARAEATITFHVVIANPLRTPVARLSNQGSLAGTNVPTTPTDDPDTAAGNDPTLTPVAGAVALEVTKRDFLFNDTDGSDSVTPGDTLVYVIKASNQGNIVLTDVVLEDIPDANTTLVNGRVQTSQGAVETGNATGDAKVVIRLSSIPPNATINIGFQVTVAASAGETVTNQAVAVFLNPNDSRASVTIRSDDPDTGSPDDPTVTPLGPSGQAGGPASVYLPLIAR